MKNLSLITFLNFTFCLFGCYTIEPENDLHPIEGNINFSVTYDSTNIIPDHTGFVLLLKTEKIYSCANFGIKSALSFKNGKIALKLLGIDRDEICLTALGPATSRIPLNIISDNFEFDINYLAETDKYLSKISDLNVLVQTVNASFSSYQEYDFNF